MMLGPTLVVVASDVVAYLRGFAAPMHYFFFTVSTVHDINLLDKKSEYYERILTITTNYSNYLYVMSALVSRATLRFAHEA